MYTRLCNPLLSRSFFLFGARGTGKTTLIRELFAKERVLWIDLLHEEEMLQFIRNLGALPKRIKAAKPHPEWIVIDEIQKVPQLLDEVHALIENRSFTPRLKFALTGSSARKLRRGAANLLAGRALLNKLHPLTFHELKNDFNLDQALTWGTLPDVVTASNDLERQEILRTYVSAYLKEEIREEQLVRKLDPFLRFLEIAAQSNGEILNYSKIARDTLTNPKSVERYFEILNDTLIGFFLDPFHRSLRKRQAKKSKFYLFDCGVKRAIEGTIALPIMPRTFGYGKAFEHFVILECIRLNDYLRKDFRFSYFATKDVEVDLVVERPSTKIALIEIKSGNTIDEVKARRLHSTAQSFGEVDCFVFSQVSHAAHIGGVTVLPWQDGMKMLFELA